MNPGPAHVITVTLSASAPFIGADAPPSAVLAAALARAACHPAVRTGLLDAAGNVLTYDIDGHVVAVTATYASMRHLKEQP